MFDKNTFAKIIRNIKESYESQEEFAKKSGIGRTYLSQYMNAKLDIPPKPKTLEKLADASHGITTYEELMIICGYIYQPVSAYIDFAPDELKKTLQFLVSYINNNNVSIESLTEDKEFQAHTSDLSNSDQKTLLNVINEIFMNSKYKAIKNNLLNYSFDELGNPVVKIPLLGTVKAGYNYMAQENWEGMIEVDRNLIKDGSDYFALRIKGDSMSPILMENDIVIIKKQNDFETGDLVVAIVNGDEATIKKGKKGNNSILLQPLNTSYEPLIFTEEEMKTIPVEIIGIVKQLKRDF